MGHQVLQNPVSGTMPHAPGMPHTPGINYVNGMGYLDLGTAPAMVISRFSEFVRTYSTLSHALNHLLAREAGLWNCRKYRFMQPADSRWLLPLTQADASGMNSQLTDAVRRLDSLVVRQRLDSRAAALEELLLGEVGSPPDTTPSPMSERMKFNTHAVEVTPQPLSISYETKTLPTSKSQDEPMSHSPFRNSEHIERVELPYQSSSSLQSGRLTIESVGINGRSSQPSLSESRIIDTSAKNTVVVKGVKKKFACHICGKEYNTRQYVKQHVRCVHKKENQEGHLVTINNKTQLTQVTTNGQQVTPRGQETQHIQFIKPYICHADGCGMKFQTSATLQKHQRNVHGMIHGISSTSSSHVTSNHSTTTIIANQHSTSNSNPGTGTTTVVTHTGGNSQNHNPEDDINKVECDMCGKLVRETSLAAHKKRHELAEKRPFKCEICGKGFMRTVTLRDHMNTHNGVKPHKCRVCGRGWASRPNMLKHVREKHPEARLPQMGGSGGAQLQISNGSSQHQSTKEIVEEVDVKNDPGRPLQIEYKDIHPQVAEPQHVRVSQGLSVSTHAVGVAGHGGPSESVTSSGDIQSILQRAIRPDSSHNSAPSSQSFTIGQSGRQPSNQPLHLSIGSTSTVVSQPLQIPMNEH